MQFPCGSAQDHGFERGDPFGSGLFTIRVGEAFFEEASGREFLLLLDDARHAQLFEFDDERRLNSLRSLRQLAVQAARVEQHRALAVFAVGFVGLCAGVGIDQPQDSAAVTQATFEQLEVADFQAHRKHAAHVPLVGSAGPDRHSQ